MDLHQKLQHIGLHRSEATVYQFLLEHGLSTPPQIAQGTKIARTNCYNILVELKNQLLITEQRNGKRKAYIANDPEALFQRVREQKERIEDVLPDLRGLYATHQNKPVVRFFDGFEQVKEIYYMVLSAKEVYGVGSTDHLSRQEVAFYEGWLKEVKQKNIVFHDILSYSSGKEAAPAMKEALRGLYEYHLMPEEQDDFSSDLLIWDDNIALLSFGKPVFGTVITNATLVATFKIIFQSLWQYLPKTEFIEAATTKKAA